ncbi:MAG: zinc dependent phospholipase C family protein [Defluviitaleaceae bacterium]|nr:zinc dependent phospholipase C family protein [Defluviitaleaceae bacterium]
MPGFITHYICGQAVLNTVSSDTQKMIRPYQQFYNIGTQGPDIFFYYLPGLLKKNTRDIGIQMHKHHFGAFISHMIDYMLQDNLPEDARSLMLAYISGFLTHYALDATAHPYVYSKTGMRKKGDKAKAIKYSVNHRKFETAIDVLMLELMSSKKPSDYKLWELIQVAHDPAQVVATAMSSSISKAYDREINAKDVYKAMRYMVRLTKILQSGKGRRKRLMELIENLTIGDHLFSSIIHMQQISDGVDYMNIKKSPWNLPGIPEKKEKNDSFVELYHDSIQQSVHMIDTLWRCMSGEVSRDKLALTLGDRSLATGFTPDPSIVLG